MVNQRLTRLYVPHKTYSEIKEIAKAHESTVSEIMRQGLYYITSRYHKQAVKTLQEREQAQ